MRNVLVYHDSSNLWYASLTLRGFTRFARQQGWRLVSLPRIAASKEPARFRRMVKTMNPVGLFANYTEGLRKVVPGVVPSVWIDCADETILPRTVAMIGTDNVKIAELAAAFEGYPYKYGGKDPETGFDCSGLVWYVYRENGIELPRTSDAQARAGELVPPEEIMPGDILCFYQGSWVGHVGIYLGDDWYVHAEGTGIGVKIAAVSDRTGKIETRRVFE